MEYYKSQFFSKVIFINFPFNCFIFEFFLRYYKNIIFTFLLALKRISTLKKIFVPKPLRFQIINLSLNLLIEMNQNKFSQHKNRNRKRFRDEFYDEFYWNKKDKCEKIKALRKFVSKFFSLKKKNYKKKIEFLLK